VLLALAGEVVPLAVNVNADPSSDVIRAFLALGEQLGRMLMCLLDELPPALEINYEGQVAEEDTRVLTLAVLKGVLATGGYDPVSYVNVRLLAEERGLEIRESTSSDARGYRNLVVVRGGDHVVSGTLAGGNDEARVVMVDDYFVDVPSADHVLIVRNADRIGMLAIITAQLAEAGIGISAMALGQRPNTSIALMAIATNGTVPARTIARLRATSGIEGVAVIEGHSSAPVEP
jgi:D-3-phosphoglycerate dehydrogenase